MTKSRGLRTSRKVWTTAEEELLRRNYADSLTADLARVCECSIDQVLRKAHSLGLAKSVEFIAAVARERTSQPDSGCKKGWFPKGNVPVNKGVKQPKGWAPGEMAKTQFKRGHKPCTWVPLGSYTVNPDGHLERKVRDESCVARSVNWRPVYLLVWEAAHGPVPPGHAVVFKPGMKTTVLEEITLDRLELLTRRELMARNSIHTQYPPELVRVAQLRGALTRAINRRAKDEAHEQ